MDKHSLVFIQAIFTVDKGVNNECTNMGQKEESVTDLIFPKVIHRSYTALPSLRSRLKTIQRPFFE